MREVHIYIGTALRQVLFCRLDERERERDSTILSLYYVLSCLRLVNSPLRVYIAVLWRQMERKLVAVVGEGSGDKR